jgi:hypothetical protein
MMYDSLMVFSKVLLRVSAFESGTVLPSPATQKDSYTGQAANLHRLTRTGVRVRAMIKSWNTYS